MSNDLDTELTLKQTPTGVYLRLFMLSRMKIRKQPLVTKSI